MCQNRVLRACGVKKKALWHSLVEVNKQLRCAEGRGGWGMGGGGGGGQS